MLHRRLEFGRVALAALVASAAFASCRQFHPPFPDVPDEAVPAPPPKPERRTEYWDDAALHKKHEWHVLLFEGGKSIADGEDLEWWPNGTLRSKRAFDHGDPRGTWTTWYEDGTKRSECELGKDADVATMSWWRENGELSSRGPSKNGVRQGRWTSWYPGGAKESEGEYSDNRRSGSWTFWNQDGSLAERAEYANGVKTHSERGGTPR